MASCALGREGEYDGNNSGPERPPSDMAESEKSQRRQLLADHEQQCGGTVVSHRC